MMMQIKPINVQTMKLTWSYDRPDAQWQLFPVIAKQLTTSLKAQTQLHQQLLMASAYHEVTVIHHWALIPIIAIQQQPALTVIQLSQAVVWNSASHQPVDVVIVLQLDENDGDPENQRVIADSLTLLKQAGSLDQFVASVQSHLIW